MSAELPGGTVHCPDRGYGPEVVHTGWTPPTDDVPAGYAPPRRYQAHYYLDARLVVLYTPTPAGVWAQAGAVCAPEGWWGEHIVVPDPYAPAGHRYEPTATGTAVTAAFAARLPYLQPSPAGYRPDFRVVEVDGWEWWAADPPEDLYLALPPGTGPRAGWRWWLWASPHPSPLVLPPGGAEDALARWRAAQYAHAG